MCTITCFSPDCERTVKRSEKVKFTLDIRDRISILRSKKVKDRNGANSMGISDLIAGFIRDALDNANGVVELQRSDLAERFHCVPSQINYVMSTRFPPENGYIVESRRGGGGYIRITRVHVDRPTLLMSVINSIGESIDRQSAAAITKNLSDAGAISRETAGMILAATGDQALQSVPTEMRGALRADLMRQMLIRSV